MFYIGTVLWFWRPFYRHCWCNFFDVLSVFVVCTRKLLWKGNLKKSSTLSQRKVKVRSYFVLIRITMQPEALCVSSLWFTSPVFFFCETFTPSACTVDWKKKLCWWKLCESESLARKKVLDLTVITLVLVEYEMIQIQRGATCSYPTSVSGITVLVETRPKYRKLK